MTDHLLYLRSVRPHEEGLPRAGLLAGQWLSGSAATRGPAGVAGRHTGDHGWQVLAGKSCMRP